MDQVQHKAIIDNWDKLVEELPGQDVIDRLVSDRILDQDDATIIISLSSTEERNAEILRRLIASKSSNTYQLLLDALKSAQNSTCVLTELIENRLNQLHQVQQEDERKKLFGILMKAPGMACNDIPELPSHLVIREKLSKDLLKALYSLNDKHGWIFIRGGTGSGKTVLVNQAVRDANIINTYFPSGFVWLNIGPIGINQLLVKAQELLLLLSGSDKPFPCTIEGVRECLEYLIADKFCSMLLILDDVWDSKVLEYFDLDCTKVVTTRESTFFYSTQGYRINLNAEDGYTSQEAKNVFSSWFDGKTPEDLSKDTIEIINEFKSFPLALAFIGGNALSDEIKFQFDFVTDCASTNDGRLKDSTSHRMNKIYYAISKSLNVLDVDLASKLRQLAVLQKDAGITCQALSILWNIDEHEAENIMNQLANKSLVLVRKKRDDSKPPVYQLHDSMIDYLVANSSNFEDMHKRFLSSYFQKWQGDWSGLMNDKYIRDNLIQHLIEAKELDKVVLFLTDLEFLEAKLRTSLMSKVLNDYIKCRTIISKENWESVGQFYQFVACNGNIYSVNPQQSLIQIALSKLSWPDIYDKAERLAKKHCKDAFYIRWGNCQQYDVADQSISSTQIHNNRITCCSISSDGNLIVSSCEGGEIKVWDSLSAAVLVSIHGAHNDRITCCCFSNNGKRIATSSWDHTVKLWDTKGGQLILKYENHSFGVNWCEFSADDQQIVSCSADQLVKIWNSSTGKEISTCRGHGGGVLQCHFTKDGQKVISCSSDEKVKVWDAKCGKLILSCACPHRVSACSLFDDDSKIMSICRNTVCIWSTANGSLLNQFHCSGEITASSISFDSKYFALCVYNVYKKQDITLQVWDVKKKKAIATYSGHTDIIYDVRFSPNDNGIVTASYDKTIKFWNRNRKKSNRVTTVKNQLLNIKVYDCKFIDNYLLVYAVDETKNRLNMYVVSEREVKLISKYNVFGHQITAVCISNNGKYVAIGFDECGGVQLLSANDIKSSIWSIKGGTHNIDFVTSIQFGLKSDNMLVLEGKTQLFVLNAIGEIQCKYSTCDDKVSDCAMFPSGSKIVACYNDTFKIWPCIGAGQPVVVRAHDDAIICCDVSKEENMLATAALDKLVKLWDCTTGSLLASFNHSSDVTSCKFSANCQFMATTCTDGTVKLWNVKSNRLRTIVRGHLREALNCYFIKNDTTLLSVGDSLLWWHLEDEEIIQNFPLCGNANIAYYTDDMKYFATYDDKNYLYFLSRITPKAENLRRMSLDRRRESCSIS